MSFDEQDEIRARTGKAESHVLSCLKMLCSHPSIHFYILAQSSSFVDDPKSCVVMALSPGKVSIANWTQVRGRGQTKSESKTSIEQHKLKTDTSFGKGKPGHTLKPGLGGARCRVPCGSG